MRTVHCIYESKRHNAYHVLLNQNLQQKTIDLSGSKVLRERLALGQTAYFSHIAVNLLTFGRDDTFSILLDSYNQEFFGRIDSSSYTFDDRCK